MSLRSSLRSPRGWSREPADGAAVTGIVSAMHEELRALLALLDAPTTVRLGARDFHQGTLHGRPVVLALSGIGKVGAATTTVLLLQAFGVGRIVFTGVAGGLAADVAIGDVVVARQLLQHDLDASPLYPRFQVPSTGCSHIPADAGLANALAAAALRCLGSGASPLSLETLRRFGAASRVAAPRLHQGLVVSGDQFIAARSQSDRIRAELPDALACEMEGAAVAQVCADFDRPFAVLRTISDRADDAATVDFLHFIAEVASVYTALIVADWLRHDAPAPE